MGTPSATRRTTMASCASFSTTLQCLTAQAQPCLQTLPFLRPKSDRCRQPGPAPSRPSPRPTWMEATTLQLRRRRQVNSTAMAARMCCSSQPRQGQHSSGQQPKMPCPTSLGTRTWRVATPRMLVSRSTAARVGQTSSSTTTRSRSWAKLPSPWATTISPAPKTAARPKLNTPSATRRTTMASCASFSTTLQCPTALAQLSGRPLRRSPVRLCLPPPLPRADPHRRSSARSSRLSQRWVLEEARAASEVNHECLLSGIINPRASGFNLHSIELSGAEAAVLLRRQSSCMLNSFSPEPPALWHRGDSPPEATVLLHAQLCIVTLSGHGKRCRSHVADAFHQRSASCTAGSQLTQHLLCDDRFVSGATVLEK